MKQINVDSSPIQAIVVVEKVETVTVQAEQGTPGADGPDGADGAPGTNGTNGTNGIDGNDGADGADGATGADGADGAAGPSRTAIEVESPSGSERIVWFRNYATITVNEITAVLNGSGSPSVTFSIRYDADRSAVGTELLTGGRVLTNTTTGVAYVPDVTSIPADVWVWLQTTAQSGTVLEMTIGMEFTP